jgi:hypothetical protein
LSSSETRAHFVVPETLWVQDQVSPPSVVKVEDATAAAGLDEFADGVPPPLVQDAATISKTASALV